MEEEKKVEEVNKESVDNENESRNKLIIIISVISIILFFILVLFLVIFLNSPKKVVVEKKTGGEVNISYTEKKNVLNIVNATPMEDSVAIKDLTGDNYFEFSVDTKIEDANEVEYEISISKNTAKCTINDSDIKIYLEKESSGSYAKVFGPDKFKGISKTTDLGTPKGEMVLAKVSNKKSVTENYRLKIWLSNEAAVSTVSQNYSVDINVKGKAK